jgi:hypothetical protein
LVVQVLPEPGQALLLQIVDDPLNVLAVAAHVACPLGHQLWLLRGTDAA